MYPKLSLFSASDWGLSSFNKDEIVVFRRNLLQVFDNGLAIERKIEETQACYSFKIGASCYHDSRVLPFFNTTYATKVWNRILIS